MELVIMAAGMGSRFGGLKQIEPIDEQKNFIIDYSIFDAIRAGFDKIVFVIKEENYDIFRETVGRRIEKHVATEYVFQRQNDFVPEGLSVPASRVKPLGTAHAILCCKYAVQNNFAIINADDFYGYDAFRVMAEFLKSNKAENAFSLVGYNVVNTLTENGAVKRGVCVQNGEYLDKLIESSIEKVDGKIVASPLSGEPSFEMEESGSVSMNMLGFSPMIFNYIEKRFVQFLSNDLQKNPDKAEFLIPDIVSEVISHELATVEVLNTDAVWHGVTYKEDKADLVKSIKEMVEAGEYPSQLW